jgi:hypothetical protein
MLTPTTDGSERKRVFLYIAGDNKNCFLESNIEKPVRKIQMYINSPTHENLSHRNKQQHSEGTVKVFGEALFVVAKKVERKHQNVEIMTHPCPGKRCDSVKEQSSMLCYL